MVMTGLALLMELWAQSKGVAVERTRKATPLLLVLPPAGAKPAHDENRYRVKLRCTHKMLRTKDAKHVDFSDNKVGMRIDFS